MYSDNELLTFLNHYIDDRPIISPLVYEREKQNIDPFLLTYQLTNIDKFKEIINLLSWDVDRIIFNMNLLFSYKNLTNNGRLMPNAYYQTLIDTFFKIFTVTHKKDFFEINGWQKLIDCFQYLELSTNYIKNIQKESLKEVVSSMTLTDIIKFFKVLHKRNIKYSANNVIEYIYSLCISVYDSSKLIEKDLNNLMDMLQDINEYITDNQIFIDLKYKIEADLTILQMSGNKSVTCEYLFNSGKKYFANMRMASNSASLIDTIDKVNKYSLEYENENYIG